MPMLARAGAVQQHLDLPPEPSDLGFWVWLQTPKPGGAGRPDIIAADVIRGRKNASMSSAPATTTTMAIRSVRRLTGVVIDASFASNICPAALRCTFSVCRSSECRQARRATGQILLKRARERDLVGQKMPNRSKQKGGLREVSGRQVILRPRILLKYALVICTAASAVIEVGSIARDELVLVSSAVAGGHGPQGNNGGGNGNGNNGNGNGNNGAGSGNANNDNGNENGNNGLGGGSGAVGTLSYGDLSYGGVPLGQGRAGDEKSRDWPQGKKPDFGDKNENWGD